MLPRFLTSVAQVFPEANSWYVIGGGVDGGGGDGCGGGGGVGEADGGGDGETDGGGGDGETDGGGGDGGGGEASTTRYQAQFEFCDVGVAVVEQHRHP